MTDDKTEKTAYHIPVLLEKSVEGLNIRPDGTYVDVTFGGGGHSRRILSLLGDKGRLFGFDQDEDALQNSPTDKRFTFVRSNFRFLKNFMRYYGIEHVDGILADLGVSSHHFDDKDRGFSFRFEGKLDMRMNRNSSLTAADVVNSYKQEDLTRLFNVYGELKNANRLAAAITKARNDNPIETINDLLECVKDFFRKDKEKKEMAKLFQAIRMEVNHETDALREMLLSAVDILKPGGRLSVITYHSIEDRMVKNLIKCGNIEGTLEKDFYGHVQKPLHAVNNKVIIPDEKEIEINPRSRSAKLRIAEKD